MRRARASLETRNGRYVCAWRQAKGRIEIKLTVPPGAKATLILPVKKWSEVTLDGGPVSAARKLPGSKAARAEVKLLLSPDHDCPAD